MTARLNFYAAYLVIAAFSAACWWSLIDAGRLVWGVVG